MHPYRLPTVDLAAAETPAGRATAVDAVRAAGADLGFLYLVDPGLDPAVLAAVHDRAAAFFALPAEVKARSAMGTVSEFSGWNALGSQRLADTFDSPGDSPGDPPGDPPAEGAGEGAGAYAHDLKESVGIGPPGLDPADPFRPGPEAQRFFAPVPWPDLPGFRSAFTTAWRTLDALAMRVMRLFALGLDLPERHFDPLVDRSISHLYVHRYPPVDPPVAGTVRAGAHTDFGSLTILDTGANPEGLEVRDPDGRWLPVEPPPGALVVNLGDAMQQWTNDRWRSSVHRVVAPSAAAAARGRMTVTFFHQPNWDTVIAPLPTCVDADRPPRHGPITSAAHYAAKVARLEGQGA